MSLMCPMAEVLGVVALNIDLAKATPNRIPDFFVDERLVVGVRARAVATINYLVNCTADETGRRPLTHRPE
jgi:hypothetical protein